MSADLTSPLGPLPPEWRLAAVREIATKIGSGATPKGGESVYLEERSRFALVRSQNVHDRHFDDSSLAFISDSHARELRGAELKPGDLLLNITGDGVTFARACLVPQGILPACVNQHVSIIRLRPDACLPGYLLSYLTHPQIKSYIESFNAGGSRRAITKGNIESFRVPIPPLAQQRRISEILGALDDKIELNRRINQTLEAMARAIFKSWFVDFEPVREENYSPLPTLEDSEIGSIPKGWSIGRLDDLLVLQRGFDLPSNRRSPGPYPVMAASGPSGTHSEAMVKGPGVTTGRSGVLGSVYLVFEDFWPLNTSLWVKEFRRSCPAHAYFLLQTLDLAIFNAGSAVPTLNRNHIHGLPMVVPPLSVIQEFEEVAMPMMQLRHSKELESCTLASIRDALLPKLLSGEIRISQAEKLAGKIL